MFTTDLKTHLNEAQETAVLAENGPVLVLAGAGSGKTRVLVQRIVHFIRDLGIVPQQLLAVTFTNKAAGEMKARLEAELGPLGSGLWIGTFHSIAHRLLKAHWKEAGLLENFQILDADDQQRMIKRLIQSLKWDETLFEPKHIAAFINRQKEEGKRARHVGMAYSTEIAQWTELYQHYEHQCARLGLVDFSELLLAVQELWQKAPQLLHFYQSKFYAILVDEFQDTNTIQYLWLKELAGPKGHLTAVGDDDQSIYGWRGAKIENIQRFNRDFPGARIIRLEQNYRSTEIILKAANALIENNQHRLGKSLWTELKGGEPIGLYAAFNEIDEALFIARNIQELANTAPLEEIAVLYRSHAQSRVLEQALLQKQIPYRVYGGLRFFERAEIKDALAYLRLIGNLKDDLAFERIINVPARGVGEKTLDTIRQAARTHQVSLFEALEMMVEELSLKRQQPLQSFIQLIHELRAASEHLPLDQLLEQALKRSRLWSSLEEDKQEKMQAKLENLQELLTAAEQFSKGLDVNPKDILQAFLAEVALDVGEHMEASEQAVKLMTLHAAKGLEFSHVFLSGLEEGLFPHHRTLQIPRELEEERRLCYVGITRAKRTVTLSFARSRAFAGRSGESKPSRFIQEVPKAFLKILNVQSQVPVYATRLHAKPEECGGFSLGQTVSHPRFGEGVIMDIAGHGEMARVQIRFKEGSKWLVLAYAKLEAV